MLSDASSSLGKIKIFFKLPAIFISVLLSVLNSSKFNETEEIKIVNTVFNALIALLIGVENTLQIDNKKQVFTSTKNKFEKLMSNIEKKILDTSEPASIEFVQNCITEFELIDDDLTFDIPKSVRNRVKRDFIGKRTLPLILGGDKRTEPLPLPESPQTTQEPTQSQQVQQVSQLSQPPQGSDLLNKVPKLFQKIPTVLHSSQLSQPSQLPQQILQPSQLSQLSQLPQQLLQQAQLSQLSQLQQLPQQQQLPQAPQISNNIQLPQVLQVIKPDLTMRLEETNALALIPEQETNEETTYDEIMDIIDPNSQLQL